jgi:hypothetical protein
MVRVGQDPAEGSREVVERELRRAKSKRAANVGGHPENAEGAAKATKDNDLTTGHSRKGDGGDDNSKRKH